MFEYLTGFALCLDEECTVDDTTNNPRGYGNVTALHLAALAGKVKMVTSLVTNGADVNKQTTLGDTPLFEACFEGHLSVVKYLVEAGADLSIPNNRKTTCLMIASYADNANVIKYLIQKNLDVNAVDIEGRNAMFYTAAGGRLDTLIFLFDNGCQVHFMQKLNVDVRSTTGGYVFTGVCLNMGGGGGRVPQSLVSGMTQVLSGGGGHLVPGSFQGVPLISVTDLVQSSVPGPSHGVTKDRG